MTNPPPCPECSATFACEKHQAIATKADAEWMRAKQLALLALRPSKGPTTP